MKDNSDMYDIEALRHINKYYFDPYLKEETYNYKPAYRE